MKFKKVKAILLITLLVFSLTLFNGCVGAQETNKDPIEMQVKTPAEMTTDLLTPTPKEEETPGIVDPPQEPWVPEIIDRDPPYTGDGDFDDTTKYVYSAMSFSSVSGSFAVNSSSGDTVYTTSAANSMTVCDDSNAAFPYGTISCSLKTVSGTDSGIVFGLNSNKSSYWEGSGISYYFFFLSQGGMAYLGKTDNGKWSALQTVSFSFNVANTNELKVVYKNGKICGYVNDNLAISYKDNSPLTGTAFGLRSGATGVVFSELFVTNDYLY